MKSAVTFLLLTWSLLLLACSPAGNTHGSDAGLDSGNDVIGDSDTIDSDCCSDADTDSATDVIDATGLIDPDNPRISIKFINVGQGDATIISVPGGKTLIFDTGRKVSDGQHLGSLLWGLSPQEVILAVSHYDSDHMGAIEVLFSGPDGAPGVAGVDDDASGSADETTVAGEYGWPGSDDLLPALVLDRGLTYLPSTTDMDQYVAACEEVRQQPAPGDIIPMGLPELTVQVLAVNGILMDGTDVNPLYENDRSMVLLVTYGAFSLLLTGDLPSYTESLVAQQLFDQGIKLDVLHAGHHGSFT
ncbi:hypothetical protein KJ865_07885, partial [Myxococcota bacterium]|nr:hypothetical protein [Myxococcota bacterium]